MTEVYLSGTGIANVDITKKVAMMLPTFGEVPTPTCLAL